jgi:hypothetical protein
MSIPHRDDALVVAALCPHDDDEPRSQVTCGDVSDLAVAAPVVTPGKLNAREYLRRIGEIQPALGQGFRAFHFVSGNRHFM